MTKESKTPTGGSSAAQKALTFYAVLICGNNVYLQNRPRGAQLFAAKGTPAEDPKTKVLDALKRKTGKDFTASDLEPLTSKRYHDGKEYQDCLVFKVELSEPLEEDPLRTYYTASIEDLKSGAQKVRVITREIISKNVTFRTEEEISKARNRKKEPKRK